MRVNTSDEIRIFLEVSVCDVVVVEPMFEVNPTHYCGKNTESLTQDFIDFTIKPIKIVYSLLSIICYLNSALPDYYISMI